MYKLFRIDTYQIFFMATFQRKFYRRFVYFEDTVTYFDKIVMFSHREEANRYLEIYPAIIVLKWGLNALFILPK